MTANNAPSASPSAEKNEFPSQPTIEEEIVLSFEADPEAAESAYRNYEHVLYEQRRYRARHWKREAEKRWNRRLAAERRKQQLVRYAENIAIMVAVGIFIVLLIFLTAPALKMAGLLS